jgi:chromosome segregation ATPase
MNNASADVNSLENEAAVAQQQYQQNLLEWTNFTEDMRAKHGRSFDVVRPYFDAVHRARNASQRAQGLVRMFSAASSQCKQAKIELRKIEGELDYGAHNVSLDCEQQELLSRATVHALTSQQERDKCEREYSQVLKEYDGAKADLEKRRATIGEAQIRRMVPCFQQLQHRQNLLAERQKRVSALQERIRIAKNAYHQSMRSLDRISTAVHNARKEHRELANTTLDVEACCEDLSPCHSLQESCPEQDHPIAESAETFAFGDALKSLALSANLRSPSAATPEVTRSHLPLCTGEVVDDGPFA